jgi:hypothetical protein
MRTHGNSGMMELVAQNGKVEIQLVFLQHSLCTSTRDDSRQLLIICCILCARLNTDRICVVDNDGVQRDLMLKMS